MSYNIFALSNKLISMAQIDVANGGELMTNLKLQKLLYYQQGYHLAVFDAPLFDEDIEAWTYGPVVPTVYRHFQQYQAGSLPMDTDEVIRLSDKEEKLFGEVYEAYREFSAIGLVNQTHKEAPWQETQPGEVITKERMKQYFETLV